MSQTDDPLTFAISLNEPEDAQAMGSAEFTQHCAERVRIEQPDAAVAIAGDRHLKIKDDDGTELDMYLDNAFRRYCGAPEDLETIVEQQLRTLRTTTGDWDSQINEENLLPVLRGRAFLEEMTRMLTQNPEEGEEALPVSDRVNDDISVLYVFDTEDAMRYVQARDLEQLTVARDRLFGRAVANLRTLLANARVEGEKGYYMPVAGGDYESSLLFLSEFWTKERFPVKGEIVVFPLARDLLIVTGSEEKKALAQATKVAAEAEETMDYFISDKPFRYKDGRWVRFTLPKRGWWPLNR